MKRDDSDQVKELFRGVSKYWTPAPALRTARMMFAPLLLDPVVSDLCAKVLSEAELETAARFLTEDEKNRFIQRRAFRRFCGACALGSLRVPLEEMIFDETEKGLPYVRDIPALRFSFSSCRFGFLGAWSCTHSIGIDFEDQTRDLEATELAQQFFSEAEARAVEEARDLARVRTFFQLWSLKESALKSIGEGLPFGLDAFEFKLPPDLQMVNAPVDYGGPARFNSYVLQGSNACAALVTRSLT
jgi:phosphopantetheinyl transferase